MLGIFIVELHGLLGKRNNKTKIKENERRSHHIGLNRGVKNKFQRNFMQALSILNKQQKDWFAASDNKHNNMYKFKNEYKHFYVVLSLPPAFIYKFKWVAIPLYIWKV